MSTAGNPRLGLEQRIGLSELRQRTHGSPQVTVAIIDGPVLPSALSRWGAGTITLLSGPGDDSCVLQQSHGALVSLMLAARSDAPLPGLCADCRTLIRPTLGCTEDARGASLHVSEDEVAAAVLDCLAQGASIINLSLGLSGSGLQAPTGLLGQALQQARRAGAVLVWAAGNQPSARGPRDPSRSHSAVLPVAACDGDGVPATFSNLGPSIARLGVLAPGVQGPLLRADGSVALYSGTSMAAPFVSAALALLCSLDPERSPAQVLAALRATLRRPSHRTLVPPRRWESSGKRPRSSPARACPGPCATARCCRSSPSTRSTPSSRTTS